MIKLNDLIPINLLQEKEKFFAKAANYNPQFTYHKAIKQSDLNFYGKTTWPYRFLAKKILRQAEKENLFQVYDRCANGRTLRCRWQICEGN